jgi:hypothetical protein
MARPCTVCTHLDRDEIDVELTGTAPVAQVAKKHGVTRDSLARHKAAHLTPALVRLAQQRRTDASAVSVAERLEELALQASRLLATAERKSSLVAAAQLLGQARQILETIGRISGELNDRPQVNVLNVVSSPDWQQLRATILAALDPYPEAGRAVAIALMASEPVELEVGA